MRRNSLSILAVLCGLILVFGLPGIVQADSGAEEKGWIVSGAGGVFIPFQGDAGFSGIAQIMTKISPQTRLGVELDYTQFDTKIFKVKNVEVKSYSLRGLMQYFFKKEGLSPYVGAGIGLSLNQLDKKKIERGRPELDVVNKFGFGAGFIGLAGVEVPLASRVAFFAEGRLHGAFQVTRVEGGEGTSVESLSGLSGLGGLRVLF
ncbi:MAG: hypothetical protein NPIRA02_07000 [Nitrospirales bacterium]|nr:MAG: hypothetical protein NPIRA02_07000 [Nitrospirales bacterium]